MTVRTRSPTSTAIPTTEPNGIDKGKSKSVDSTSKSVESNPERPTPASSSTDGHGRSYSYTRNLWLARLLRFLGPIGFFWHTWFLTPRGIRVSETERITTRDGHEITLHIYRPRTTGKGRVCVINFHGGGWAIGYPTDDARWARWCVDGLDAVVISVDYRLSPEHPWPIGVQDCIDATKYIHANAARLGVDQGKIMLGGFSAGGCLAVTTALALAHPHLDPSPSNSVTPNPSPPISIRGIVSFYPLLDFSTPRSEKMNRSSRPDILRPLPSWMTKMFDTSYLPPDREIDRTNPLISPLLTPDELLVKLPHIHLCLCERDVLGQEGQEMADKLRELGGKGRKGEVVCRWVQGAGHGWDKPVHLLKQSVKDEYDAAVASVKRWCEEA